MGVCGGEAAWAQWQSQSQSRAERESELERGHGHTWARYEPGGPYVGFGRYGA